MTNKPDSEMTDNTEDVAGRRDSASRGGADAAAVNDETDAGAETPGPAVGMPTERAGSAPHATEAARDTTAAGGPAPATPSGSAREPDAASTDEAPEARPPAAADDGGAASGGPDATAVGSHESLTRSEAPSAETEETAASDDAVPDGTEAVPVAATAGAAEAPASASAGASAAAADEPTDTPVASLAAAEEAAEPVLATPAAADEEVESAATGEAMETASKPAEASTEAAVDEAEAEAEEAERADGARDISRGQWFFVQTLSGKEFKAKESIDRRLAQEEMEEIVFESIVPMEKVTQVKLGKKMTINRKFFPGYLLLNMELYDTNRQINDRVWNFIQDTNGVIGFIGGDRPAPLTDEEVQDVMDQVSGAEEAAKPKIEFELSDIVKIKDGPFENFEGKIESIDPARGKLKLAVAIFGRSTPVEVEYWQVERE